MFRKLLPVLCCLFISFVGNSQSTNLNPGALPLKKGFYRTYDEYLKNDPSIQPDFETQLLRASRRDTTIIAANFILKSKGDKPAKFWGFSDGVHVFVKVPELLGSNYWMLQCAGPNPYLFYKTKMIFAAGPPLMALATAAATAAAPASLDVWEVTKSGKAKYAWRKYVKAILQRKPEVLAEFKKTPMLTAEQQIKYIRAANEPG
jgi:hypothetical protein